MDGLHVAYHRVSTVRQGASGLGLDAQKRAVAEYLNGGKWEIIGEFVEIESGKRDDRPQLAKALELCRLTGARLVVSKLDRLTRNVAFLSKLEESKVDFVACDLPGANRMTVTIMVAVAEAERDAISARTKAALASVKTRLKANETYVAARSGRVLTRLGSPKGLAVRAEPGVGAAAMKAKADAFAADRAPVVREAFTAAGSLAKAADLLNARRVKTARGKAWTPMAVKRVLDRAEAA